MLGSPMPLLRSASRRNTLFASIAITAIPTLGALGALQIAQAAGLRLKPGLWEVRLVRQIVDGQDVSAQLTESEAKTQTALANLPPDARTRAQSMFHAHGDSGGNSSFRICLTPAMASADLPILDKDGSCRPMIISQSDHQVTFRIECSANGTQIKGRGQATNTGMLITAKTDVITRAADGSSHTLHNELQMNYLGADCGHVLPPERAVPAPNNP